MTARNPLPNDYLEKLPIFFQPWWLDLVCGDDCWEHIECFNGDEVSAVFAFFYKSKFGVKYISMPHFTPYLGIQYFYPKGIKESSRLSFEEKALEQVSDKLKGFTMTEFNLFPEITNVFPLTKNGYRDGLRYTYVIAFDKGVQGYISRMNQKLRKEIERNPIEIYELVEVQEFLKALDRHHQDKNIDNDHSSNLLRKIDSVLKSKGKRKVFAAFEDEVFLGGVYIIEDTHSNYLSFTVQNKEISKGGIIAKLIDHAIKFTLECGKNFDFEGSMIPGVERFFRRFGGELKPYMVISKEKNIVFRLLKALKNKI